MSMPAVHEQATRNWEDNNPLYEEWLTIRDSLWRAARSYNSSYTPSRPRHKLTHYPFTHFRVKNHMRVRLWSPDVGKPTINVGFRFNFDRVHEVANFYDLDCVDGVVTCVDGVVTDPTFRNCRTLEFKIPHTRMLLPSLVSDRQKQFMVLAEKFLSPDGGAGWKQWHDNYKGIHTLRFEGLTPNEVFEPRPSTPSGLAPLMDLIEEEWPKTVSVKWKNVPTMRRARPGESELPYVTDQIPSLVFVVKQL